MTEHTKNKARQAVIDLVVGAFLFCSTAGFVWWQNTRLTVLYDLCGVLENAARIAQGDMPYRDFPFPYAPLTFLMQAALIKWTGAVYWHHIAYACIVGGASTVIAWRVMIRVLDGRVPRPRTTAFILALPIVLLGVYCIFPHPFYDPDAAFVLLLSILYLLWAERKVYPPIRTIVLGVLFVVPLFVKQNIGIAFLGSIGIWLLLKAGLSLRRNESVRPYLLMFAGIVIGLGSALTIIHYTCGLENYKLWTITYATARRTPSFADMLSVYNDRMLIVWVTSFLVGTYLFRRNFEQKLSRKIVGLALMALPFLWPAIVLTVEPDASERAERLVTIWPLVFIVVAALGYLFIRRLRGVSAALPFVLICTAHGVFLSQQLWGSTYGIWPLLMVLVALLLRQLHDPEEGRFGSAVVPLAALVAIGFIVAGGVYVYSNERLDYVNFADGEMAHPTLPQLSGLSMRGAYIPDFEELVAYTDREIPRDEGVLYLPGEDLFYYTTGRHPHYNVLLFDVTNNPYNADEISTGVLATDVKWLIVKNDLQIEADKTIDDKDSILQKLLPQFRNVESLTNYEIYKRRSADAPKDVDDQNSDDGDTNDDNGDDDGAKDE